MGWLAGWAGLGWAGLAYRGQTYVVPISSMPFGRGPAGCGAAANNPRVPVRQRRILSAAKGTPYGPWMVLR